MSNIDKIYKMKAVNLSTLKLSGIAGGAFLLSKVKPEWGQSFLYEHLRNYPGIPAKFSQWLEQKWDVQSTKTLPIIEKVIVSEILQSELPEFWEQVDSISEIAWVASLGQVHKIVLKTGEELAIKIQYPELENVITTQLDSLIWMMEKSPAKNYGFNGELWRQEFYAMFEEELNYINEAHRQDSWYQEIGKTSASVQVPQVYLKWCRRNILVQEWVEGLSFDELKKCEKEEKEVAALALARMMIHSLLSQTSLHGDLQPKNWAWCRKSNRIILYDFGSCISWNQTQQRVFESLVISLRDRVDKSPFDFLVALGFEKEKLLPISAQLSLLVECLLEPIWDERFPCLSQWKVQSHIQNLLGEGSWYFRTAGPPWFLWLMRSLGGWFFALEELYDRIPLAQIFNEEQQKLDSNRWLSFSIPSFKDYVESHSNAWSLFKDKAQCLRVRIRENHEDRVLLKFPIHLVGQLEDLISPEVSEKIKEQNLNISDIKTKALQSGLVKQDLFKIQNDKKLIHVWIE